MGGCFGKKVQHRRLHDSGHKSLEFVALPDGRHGALPPPPRDADPTEDVPLVDAVVRLERERQELYRKIDRLERAASAAPRPALLNKRVYAPRVRCINTLLNAVDDDEAATGCCETWSSEDLRAHANLCADFYGWMLKNRACARDSEHYDRFLQSGRVWAVHATHLLLCGGAGAVAGACEDNAVAIAKGLGEWLATLLEVNWPAPPADTTEEDSGRDDHDETVAVPDAPSFPSDVPSYSDGDNNNHHRQ